MSVRGFLARFLALVVALSGASMASVATPAHGLAAPVSVTGAVVDAVTGEPVPDAFVELIGPTAVETTTDATGGFVAELEPGPYGILVSAEAYQDQFVETEVTASTTALPTVELEPLPDPVPVTGTVVDALAGGAGVAGADVQVVGPTETAATTDADGSYTVALLPGLYELSASAPGYEDGFVNVDVTEETTQLPPIELSPATPGVLVTVTDETFGTPAAGAQVSLQLQGSGPGTVVTADEDGKAFFPNVAPGGYVAVLAPGGGFVPVGESAIFDYEGGLYEVSLSALADLRCAPDQTNEGLTNMGFESGLDGWTLGFLAESVEAVGADGFTSPWEGDAMARLGRSRVSEDETQRPGPNILCQDFEVTRPEETFAFNVFTYDYTGFDEFRFDVVVTDPSTGETLAAYEQGAWGEGTALKTSGWRGVRLDLGDRVGDTVRLTFRAGGTSDSLYAFWAYLDSAAELPPTVELPTTAVQTETGSVTTDPVTGQLTVSMPFGAPSDLTVTVPGECQASEVVPTSVDLLLNGQPFPAEGVGDGQFEATIPAGSVESGTLSLQVTCPDETTVVTTIGQIVLYDPSGIVSDAATGEPVVGAEVRLHKVPGWTPQDADGPHPPNSCQSNLSKPEGAPWDQPAPVDEGVLVNPASPEISPNVNPFVTNNIGYYGWDVAEGCWYVVVEADGYQTLTSPVVGVPPEVTDLDLQLERAPVTSLTPPAVTGSPKVGGTLTASPGTWSPDDVAVEYRWLRDGEPVAGATASTYAVQPGDVGRALRVQVTARKAGLADGVAQSDAVTGQPGDAPTALTAPSVAGAARVGGTLTASPGTWNLPGVSFGYQWWRGGQPVAGATGATYAVQPVDVGKALHVRVRASRDGYVDGSAQSAPVTAVKARAAVTLSVPRVAKVGARVRATVRVAAPAGVVATGKVAVRAGRKVLAAAPLTSGRAVLRLPKLRRGTYRLVAAYGGSAAVAGAVSRPATLRVVRR